MKDNYDDLMSIENIFSEMWFKGILLPNKATTVEIGALSANISRYAIYKFGVERAFAIEASKNNFIKLKENSKNNEKLIAINKAIAASDGPIKIMEQSNSSSNSLLFIKNANIVNTYEVEGLTLETFIEIYKIDKIDLLIMNCEGSESFIIPQISSNKKIRSKIDCITMEFHPKILGQTSVMNLIILLYPFYKPEILRTNLRGPSQVIFFKRSLVQDKIELLFKYYQLRAKTMDVLWPLFEHYKKWKDFLAN